MNKLKNKYYKDLKELFKGKTREKPQRFFTKPKPHMYDKIFDDRKRILENKRINFLDYYDKEECKTFLKQEKVRVSDDGELIDEDILKKILDILDSSMLELEVIEETKNYKFRTVTPTEEDDVFRPTRTFNIQSFWLNSFYDNSILYSINKSIPNGKLDYTSSQIKTAKLRVLSQGEIVVYPTKFSSHCTISNKDTGYTECGGLIEFSNYHFSQSIKCEHGHPVSSPTSIPAQESIELYGYLVLDLNDEAAGEKLIYSLQQIEEDLIEGNYVILKYKNEEPILILLNSSPIEGTQQQLKNKILLKDDKNFTFLNDIYKSLQTYFKSQHKVTLTNQNKYIGQILIFQMIAQVFYKELTAAFVLGTSGSGKSWWADTVLPMFTMNKVKINGLSVTRNRFIGGRSNVKTSISNSLFSAGYINTKEMVFVEEAGGALSNYYDIKQSKDNNIFLLLKQAQNKEIDVAVQGSKPIEPRASIFMVGNLAESSSTLDKYYNLVNAAYRNYKSTDKKSISKKIPQYRSIEWYGKVMGDELLAKAHQKIRDDHYNSKHYVTHLPVAEQGRFDFCVVLEGELKRQKILYNNTNNLSKNVHRKEFIEELGEIFHRPKDEVYRRIYETIGEEMYEYRNNYILNGRNFWSEQLKKRVIGVCSMLFCMQRQYWNEEVDIRKNAIKETELDWIKNWMKYNYNSLDEDEAAMKVIPFTNDYFYDTDVMQNENDNFIEQMKDLKLKEEREQREMSIDFDELSKNE